MGRATITAAQENGLYTATVKIERDRIEEELAAIDNELADLQPKIADAEEELRYKQLEVDEAIMLLRRLIDEYAAGVDVDADTNCEESTTGLLSSINSIRSANGLPPVAADDSLNAAAQGHSTWLAQNNKSGHDGQGGSNPGTRIYNAGFTGSTVAENVAVGLPTTGEAIDGWMNSPGHRENILNPEFTKIGVGYNCRTSGPYQHFWTMTFGG